MTKNLLNSQTAYTHNSHSSQSDKQVKDHGWSPAINKMIDQRYAFLDLQYEEQDYLFRGMSSGLSDAILENKFWHYAGDDRGNHFEKELGVILVSQDFSDAYTVSKMWEQELDACILILKSEIFNRALADKEAAMLATAEPGVVFKYPFLCQPLTLDDIEYFIVSCNSLESLKKIEHFNKMVANKLIVLEDSKESYDRTVVEKIIIEQLSSKEIRGAKTVKNNVKPTRIT